MTRQQYLSKQCHWSCMDDSQRDTDYRARAIDTLTLIGRYRRSFGKGTVVETLWRVYRKEAGRARIF